MASFFACFNSNFSYGILSYHGSCISKMFFMAQKRFIEIISKATCRPSCKLLFLSCKLLNLPHLFYLEMLPMSMISVITLKIFVAITMYCNKRQRTENLTSFNSYLFSGSIHFQCWIHDSSLFYFKFLSVFSFVLDHTVLDVNIMYSVCYYNTKITAE